VTRKRRIRILPGIHEPNLTPLIDVSLVLVVILLVATPLALQSGIAVSRTPASGRAGAAVRDARVEISILDAEHLMVNRTPTSRMNLGAALAPLLAASPTREVVVRCADEVPHGTFVGVIDEAKARGAGRIAVVEQ
jgi:biopolymer transport protein ExbD